MFSKDPSICKVENGLKGVETENKETTEEGTPVIQVTDEQPGQAEDTAMFKRQRREHVVTDQWWGSSLGRDL